MIHLSRLSLLLLRVFPQPPASARCSWLWCFISTRRCSRSRSVHLLCLRSCSRSISGIVSTRRRNGSSGGSIRFTAALITTRRHSPLLLGWLFRGAADIAHRTAARTAGACTSTTTAVAAVVACPAIGTRSLDGVRRHGGVHLITRRSGRRARTLGAVSGVCCCSLVRL